MSAVATDHLIKPHGGVLVDRTGDAPDDLDSLQVVQLTSRELSDLDMIASGALSPLEGFMGQADYESVLENMRLANGLPWSLPVCLAVDAAPEGDRVALADESGKLVAVLEVEGTFDYDKEREAELAYRTTDTEHPGVARLFEQKPMYLAGKVTVFERATPQFPELARDPADTRRDLRRARLEARRRLPDPQPDPPRPRVPDQGRAGDGRRAADPPARRRHEGRRRPGGDARRVLRRARRELLPGRPRARLRLPGGDALRRAARGDLARDLPQELRLLALHRRPRPRGCRLVLRHLRRAADLRRVRAARARHRADVLRAHVLVQDVRLDGQREDLPAPVGGPRLPVGDEGARDARQRRGAAGRVLPRRRWPRC